MPSRWRCRSEDGFELVRLEPMRGGAAPLCQVVLSDDMFEADAMMEEAVAHSTHSGQLEPRL